MNLDKLRQAEAKFLHRYPGGFENPELMAIRKKKHKPDKMIALAQESFAKRNFEFPDLIVQNILRMITRSSVVAVFEKLKFRDLENTLSYDDKNWLAGGFEQLLHGEEQTGFEMILDLMKSRKLAKWSLMTVCQTYFHPQRDVFVKPTTVKGVIKYFELENLSYKPTPSWAFYEAYRNAFHAMKSQVDKSLSPTNPAFSGFLLMTIRGDLF